MWTFSWKSLPSKNIFKKGVYILVVKKCRFSHNEFNDIFHYIILAHWDPFPSHNSQGVLKVRKRVTLMAIAVSIIFAFSWGAESVEYVLRTLTTLNISFEHIAAVDMMVLFNSAVNPFVYALLNHQFRQNIKRVIWCNDTPEPGTGGKENTSRSTDHERTTEMWFLKHCLLYGRWVPPSIC